MARVKRAVNAHKKRRTILKASKGYRGQRSRLYRKAKEQQLHSLTYAYRDRRARKGEFRKLWIARINAAARANDITYNRLIQGLKAAGVEVDRKNLSEIAISDPAAFTALVGVARAALPDDVNAPSGEAAYPRPAEPISHPVLTERSTRVVAAVKLHRQVARRRSRLFLVEGVNLVEAASRRGLVREVFATEAAALRYADLLMTHDASVHLVTERAAKVLSDTVTPTGLVAVCELPSPVLQDVLLSAPRLVAVGVEIGEPGNAGTLIRIADAMGAGAVVFAGHSVDPYNGKCLRASAGSVFAVPVVVAPEVDAAVSALQAAGLRVLATTVDGELSLDDADLTTPTAWLFGAEAHGLSAQLAERADNRVIIPMSGSAQSLNVAAAAAICLYQSARAQRAGSDG